MIRIGVGAIYEAARWSFWEDRAALVPDLYHRALAGAGAIDLPLVPDPRVTADPDLLLDLLDGLLLIGGLDLDPSRYGASADPALEGTDPERDDFELALAQRALERQLPLLGICRGMQILNVARGGTLRQDLGAAGNATHRPRLGSFEGATQVVEAAPGSLLATACGERQVVHCHHHQAIDALGEGLVVSARAADGVIEAIELPDHPFALGVQWHPEADQRSRVVPALVRAAERQRARG